MVVLNRIYTRTGDDGTTALGSGERRLKYDLRVAAYGTVDETNAAIGVARLHLKDRRDLDTMLGLIQNDLFDLGADLAVPEREGQKLASRANLAGQLPLRLTCSGPAPRARRSHHYDWPRGSRQTRNPTGG